MVTIKEAMDLDSLASGSSVIHKLDGRVKLISILFIIVYTVCSTQLIISIIFEMYLLLILYLSEISFKNAFKRILLLLPFGGMIIVFQPFIQPGDVIWYYSWLQITDEGLNFGILLLARIIVSLTAIVILSSTSPMQQIVESFRKLKMPNEFAMIFSLMVRFIFMFLDELESIQKSQRSRNFDIHNDLTPYKWRLKQVGYTIAMMFLKSYEHGEKIYRSMISRGYNENSELFEEKKGLERNDYIFIISLIVISSICIILIVFFSNQLGFLGQNLSIHR